MVTTCLPTLIDSTYKAKENDSKSMKSTKITKIQPVQELGNNIRFSEIVGKLAISQQKNAFTNMRFFCKSFSLSSLELGF